MGRPASFSSTTSSRYRRCLSYPLRKDGYHVTSALDGGEALQRFEEGRFDLVILDLMLPRLDGVEVCRQLRSRSQVPIIMLTAKGSETDKVAGLEVGADDYITKPFSMREFRSRVKAALRRSRMGGEAAERGVDRVRRADDRLRPPHGHPARGGGPGHLRRVRDPRRPRPLARPRAHPRDPARARLGRLRVPRPAHRRRPHPPPAGEARAATPSSPSSSSPCAASATASRSSDAPAAGSPTWAAGSPSSRSRSPSAPSPSSTSTRSRSAAPPAASPRSRARS